MVAAPALSCDYSSRQNGYAQVVIPMEKLPFFLFKQGMISLVAGDFHGNPISLVQ